MAENNQLETIPDAMSEEDSSKYIYSTVLWRIENLGHWESTFHSWEIRSPEFRLINLEDCNVWTIYLFPKGNEYDEINGFSFCLRPKLFVEDVSFVCEWSVLDSKESTFFKRVELYHTKSENAIHVLQKCPTYEEVFVTKRSSFLPNDTFTMRLRICNTKKNECQTEYLSLLSRIWVLKDSFEWRIKGISTIQLDEETVNTINVGGDLFDFHFALKGESLDESMVKISISAKNIFRSVFLRISIKGKDTKTEKSMEWKHAFNSSVREHMWVPPAFASRCEILGNRSDALGSDDLTLFVEWTASPKRPFLRLAERSYCGPKSYLPDFLKNDCGEVEKDSAPRMEKSRIAKSCKQEECTSLATLGDNLLAFLSKGSLSDFELRSEDHTSFKVHKLVLSARSPVFKAMFADNAMEETGVNSMDFPDLDATTLSRLVTFIYSGIIDDLEWENAAKLYYAADKYEIPSLKQKCSSVLRSSISVSNVPDILELADRHKDQELMSSIHEFMQMHFDAVILSDEWDKFLERSCLAGKTMKEVYKNNLASRNLYTFDLKY